MEERTFGTILVFASVILPLIYTYLLFFSPWYLETIKLTLEAAVLALAIVSLWLGRSMMKVAPIKKIPEKEEKK